MRKEHAPKPSNKKTDVEFEIHFYENILKESPNFVQALTAIGDAYTRAGFWQKGLEVDLKLARMRPNDPTVFYNLACSYALLNQTPAALSALTKAIEFGYNDFEYLRADADLENLLKDFHVQEFIKAVEKKKKSSKK